MKIILFIILSFYSFNEDRSSIINHDLMNQSISQKSNSCPENGTCTIEMVTNKSLQFEYDEFGKKYPKIIDGNKTILKYTYNKFPVKNAMDSQYREVIFAEFDNSINEVSLENKELKNVRLYLGILSFSREQQGYYPIENGSFQLERIDQNYIKVDIHFKIKKVTHVVSEIHEIISLKSN